MRTEVLLAIAAANGVGLLLGGIGAIYWPAALIIAGLITVALALAGAKLRGESR